MWDYILKNQDWIFSGIGVSLLTLVTALIKKNTDKNPAKKAVFNNRKFENSTVNNIQSEEVHLNQTIVNHVNEKEKQSIPIEFSSELIKAKQDFIAEKSRLRTSIYNTLASHKKSFPNSSIEVKDIIDESEDSVRAKAMDILQEIMEMEEAGLLEFTFSEQSPSISPYTKVLLTKKFYATIADVAE